jgi:hypothetical protein
LQLWARRRTRHCPVHTGQSGAPCRPLELPRVARGLRGRPLGAGDRWLTGQSGAPPDSPVNYSHIPLCFSRGRRVHRGRLTGQSGAPPGSPVNISRTPLSSPESGEFTRTSLAHRTMSGAPSDTVRCTTGQSGVPDRAGVGCTEPSLFSILFLLFLALRQNTLVLKTMY